MEQEIRQCFFDTVWYESYKLASKIMYLYRQASWNTDLTNYREGLTSFYKLVSYQPRACGKLEHYTHSVLLDSFYDDPTIITALYLREGTHYALTRGSRVPKFIAGTTPNDVFTEDLSAILYESNTVPEAPLPTEDQLPDVDDNILTLQRSLKLDRPPPWNFAPTYEGEYGLTYHRISPVTPGLPCQYDIQLWTDSEDPVYVEHCGMWSASVMHSYRSGERCFFQHTSTDDDGVVKLKKAKEISTRFSDIVSHEQAG